MDTVQTRSDSDIRAVLLSTARGLAAREGKFSIPRLCAEAGISRNAFYRCFTGKAAILAAIVNDDVAVLGKIAEIVEPQAAVPVAVNASAAAEHRPVGAPPVDQWLERRLRVFERALAALETRQEKFEQETTRRLSLFDEKFACASAMPAPVPAQPLPVQPAPQPVIEEDYRAELDLVEAAEKPAPETPVKPQFFLPIQEDPVSETEIADFIAQARIAAQRAAIPVKPQSGLSLPRWIAWMGVAAVTVLICAGLALGNARATQTEPVAGIAYRAEPHDSLARLMALADSGDARAETVLALAYLRGTYGAPANPEAARRWSLAAARQGDPEAQYLIASLTGKEDAARAASWFEQAALRGNIKAMHNLAIAYAQGQGVGEDDARAAAWFNRAASQGYVDSQFDLAVLFERGQGVTQNRVSALKWYLIAAKGGDKVSQSRAEQLEAEMPDEEITRARGLAAAFVALPHDSAANALAAP